MTSTDWLPTQSVLEPPSVAIYVRFNGDLAECATYGKDISAVVADVKKAVAAAANAAEGTLTIAAVTAAAAGAIGVLEVTSVEINLEPEDFVAPSFSTRPEYVNVFVPVIA